MEGRSAPEPVTVYRPTPVVRALSGLFGAICLIAAVWQIYRFAVDLRAAHLLAALVLSAPCLIAAAVLRKRIVVSDDVLTSATLLRTQSFPWRTVKWMDQTRSSVVVVLERGTVSAGWISPGERERLIRQVMQRAGLIAYRGQLRWGIRMRYVPRRQDITFRDPNDGTDRNPL